MSIIRVKKDKNYFAASNVPFNDERLSWEARGVMGYLLSKPDNWQVRFFDLTTQGSAKRYKMRRILKELEECGYLERKRMKIEDGTFDWLSTVHENPICGDTIGQLPTHGDTIGQSPTGGSATDGKPTHIVSTEPINTDIEKELDINPDGNYSHLSIAFVNKTKIPELSPNPRKWYEALEKMGEAGVEVEDIESAIDILRDRDYSIIGLSSVTNTAINEMSKRMGKKGRVLTDDERRKKYAGGELSEFIN